MRRRYSLAIALCLAGTSFAAAFGGTSERVLAYALAACAGVLLSVHADHRGSKRVFSSAVAGFALGGALSLALASGLVVWLLGAPPDLAIWLTGMSLGFEWLGLGFTMVSGLFLASVLSAID